MKKFYKGQWTGGLPETVSGSGSTVANSKGVIQNLPIIIEKYNIKSIFDAPCGDRNWIKQVDFDGVDCKYFGGDIVKEIVDDINLPNVKQFNIFDDNPPNVDLWLCRDCLFHFSESDIVRSLDNMILNSTIKYLLVTSHVPSTITKSAQINKDIVTGDFRVLIFEEYNNFNLGPAVYSFLDPSDSKYQREMLLFDLSKYRYSK